MPMPSSSRLAELLRAVPDVRLVRGSESLEIHGVEDDSRLVRPGSLFIARRGARADGAGFVEDARRRGAVALLVDDVTRASVVADGGELALLVAEDLAVAGARLAEASAGSPSRELELVGVTGTNGKTTITFLIQQLLRAAGERCGVIGTVIVDDGAVVEPATLTTPRATELSALLRRMVDHGCSAAAIECSSHALAQRRTAGLHFTGAVFTNLTGDHLDYHGSMEEYGAAKAGLFAGLSMEAFAVVNADSDASQRMLRGCPARVIRCSIRDPDVEWFAHVDAIDPGGITARLQIRAAGVEGHEADVEAALRIPLAGTHNLMNALEAGAVAAALGVPLATIFDALTRITAPPGRLEPVHVDGAACTVLVDYAHTDDALENVLRALRAAKPAGARLTVVFGCGGDRDRTKRPRMAAVAARLADRIVVTSDNPRTESPEAIIDEILTGISAERRAVTSRENDRAVAIAGAIDEAGAGDIVLIAGKGHEDYQIIGTEKRPFDDRAVARAALEAAAARIARGGPCEAVR